MDYILAGIAIHDGTMGRGMNGCSTCVVISVIWLIAGLIVGLIFGPKLKEMVKHYPEANNEW